MRGTLGNTYIDTMLGEYIPINESNQPLEEILTDETDQLLYALLVEMRAERFSRGDYDMQTLLQQADTAGNQGSVDESATYEPVAEAVPEINTEDDEPLEIDLDFVASEIDIRFDAGINVVFQNDFGSSDVVSYDAEDSPLAGVPAKTSWVYIWAQDGTGGANVQLEAWGDN